MKGITRFLLLAVIISLVIFGCWSCSRAPRSHQEVPASEFDRLFQPSELKADFDFLFQTLETVHPNLYAYTPQPVIDKERAKITDVFSSPMTRREFYIKIAPIVVQLKDGHTSIYPPFEEYVDYANKDGLLFPFDLDFRDKKAFVITNYSSDSMIVPGTELLSINGIPVIDLYNHFINFFSGERISFRNELLEKRFRMMLWLVYGFGSSFEIKYKLQPKAPPGVAKLNGVTGKKILEQRASLSSNNEKQSDYTYTSLSEEKIGVIDFRAFHDLEKFKVFLKETFTQIQQDSIESLIIDIRNNEGGNSRLGTALVKYLTDKPFVQYSRIDIKASKQIKKYFKRYIPWYIRWLPVQYLRADGRKLWGARDGEIVSFPQEPIKSKNNPLRFHGDVYVLMSSHTFSSAADFAATIKDYHIGILIGEETGGLATCYGDVYGFDLPKTHLAAGVSHKYFVRPSGEDDGRGVLPDYEVSQSLEDLEKGIDTVMDHTIELIKGKVKNER